jgi:hypothetical protein
MLFIVAVNLIAFALEALIIQRHKLKGHIFNKPFIKR